MRLRFFAIPAITMGLAVTAQAAAMLLPAIQAAKEAAARAEGEIAKTGPGAVAAARSHGIALLPPGSEKMGVSPQPFKGRFRKRHRKGLRTGRVPSRGGSSRKDTKKAMGVDPTPFRGRMRARTMKKAGAGGAILVLLYQQQSDLAFLRRLATQVHKLEKAAGPGAPCVRACRRSEQKCLASCRRTLKANGAKGTCNCVLGKANCLIRRAEQGSCNAPTLRKRMLRRR